MINVRIVAVGGLKESYLREAFAEYEKRLRRFCSFQLCEISESRLSDSPSEKEIAKALETEGKAILKECRGSVFAMCIEGKSFSSVGFAQRISSAAAEGGSHVTFVIGSSFGLSDEVKKSADIRLSMSEMTFPHQLARVMLTEQIYRAFTIINNRKYHK